MASGSDKTTAGLPHHYEARLRRLRHLSTLLDEQFRIPGTTYRIGLDGLLGLIPGAGDTLGLLLSAYWLFEAKRLGLPRRMLLRMAANIGLDALVGTIPILGDIFDVVWKANKKNLTLLEAYLAQNTGRRFPQEDLRP